MKVLIIFFLFCFSACTTTKFYVTRHAEKAPQAANMTSDVPLSQAGQQRAEALKQKLLGKVDFITSTQTIRTRATAEPLANAMKKGIHVYSHTDTALLTRYRNGNANILFVGHSNTVDDLVNFMMGKKVLSDLTDTAYGDLFIVKKKGKIFSFSRDRFGK